MPGISSNPDMVAFVKGREAQKAAEEERRLIQQELREKATARYITARTRERETYQELLRRLLALRLRIRPNNKLSILQYSDRSDRKVLDEVPSSIRFGHTMIEPNGTYVFMLDVHVDFDPVDCELCITLGTESAVGGHRVAPKGVLQEWTDVDAFMQALVQWALAVPEIETYDEILSQKPYNPLIDDKPTVLPLSPRPLR